MQTPKSPCSSGHITLRLAIAAYGLGCVLWVAALVLPAIESAALMGGPGDTATLPGWACFVATFLPNAWFAMPAVFLPLMLVNFGTLLSPLFFSDGVRNGVPKFLVVCSFLCIPVALVTLALAFKLYIGFFLWIGSLTLFFVGFALLQIRFRGMSSC